jgi:hypothetical protein
MRWDIRLRGWTGSIGTKCAVEMQPTHVERLVSVEAHMATRGRTHVDGRRLLLPRDYLAEPAAFGQTRPVRFVVPAGGDAVSAHVAYVQHWLIVRLRMREPRLSGASLARLVGVSRQTWSRTALGERWIGIEPEGELIEPRQAAPPP